MHKRIEDKLYKFSIVIPLYNKQNVITATLQTVFAQSYMGYEVIIVDDGSTDNGADIAEAVLREHMLTSKACIGKVIRKENGGVCSARNRGIQEARYDYIALLDADDQWDKDYLAEQVRLIEDFPQAKMWGVNFAEMSNGKLIRTLPTGLPKGYRGYVENYFQTHGRISDLYCSSSVVIKKDIFDKIGYFDERLRYAEDLDMWYRIIASSLVAFYDVFLVWYMHDAENRALTKQIQLCDYLPYYVDKYVGYKHNTVFYTWINKWAAHRIRTYYFSNENTDREQAKEAARKLDYSVLPSKYKLLFNKFPFFIASIINKIDIIYHNCYKK